MRGVARWLVGNQQFHHHLANGIGAVAVTGDNHAFGRGANTGCGKDAFTLNLDHAGAAVAICTIVIGVLVTQMRNIGAMAGRSLPYGFTADCLNLFAIKGEGDVSAD